MEKPRKKRPKKEKTPERRLFVRFSEDNAEFLRSVLPEGYVFTPGVGHRGYTVSRDQELIEHMARGYSFESFAGLIQVELAAIYQWEKLSPSFAEAKRIGRSLSRLWWERLSITHVAGELVRNPATGKLQQPRFLNFPLWSFNMANRFGWQAPNAEAPRRDEDDPTLAPEDRKVMSPDDWLAEVRRRRLEAASPPEDVEAVPVSAPLPPPKPEKTH